ALVSQQLWRTARSGRVRIGRIAGFIEARATGWRAGGCLTRRGAVPGTHGHADPGGQPAWLADSRVHRHPIELGRVLGQEADFAGTSFLTLDQLHHLRYASPIVNVVADARIAHGPGLGAFAYDDEGVPAQRIDIIKAGEF